MKSAKPRNISADLCFVALALAAVVLCAWGIVKAEPKFSEGLNVIDLFVRIFGAFSFSKIEDLSVDNNPQLVIGRLMAATFTIYAGWQVLRSVLGEHWVAWRLRFSRGHVIVCGLGTKGQAIAMNLIKSKAKVAGLEPGDDEDHAAAASALGVKVLCGDAREPYLLRRASIHRAAALVVTGGKDRTNIEIAMTAFQEHTRLKGKPLLCCVHVAERRMRDLLQGANLFNPTADFVLRFFNINEITARLFFAKHPPEAEAAGATRVHVVIVGFGQLGEAMALQIGKMGHFTNLQKTKLTIVDRHIDTKRESFQARYPQFGEVCELNFLEHTPGDHDAGEITFLDTPSDESRQVIVSFDDDERSLTIALEILEAMPGLALPIYLRVSEARGIANLISNAKQDASHARLVPFGAIDEVCTREVVLREELDTMARAIHQDYQRSEKSRGESLGTNTALVPWEQLPEDLREANRRQADHIQVKLRALGCHIAPVDDPAPPFEFLDGEVELLSKMEHNRWSADRYLNGWRAGPRRDNVRKIHNLLVTWEELDEPNKQKDRNAVLNMPMLLASIGRRIVRDKAPAIAPEPAIGARS